MSPACTRTYCREYPLARSKSSSASNSGTQSCRPRHVPFVIAWCSWCEPGQHTKQPSFSVWSSSATELWMQRRPTCDARWSKCSPSYARGGCPLACAGAPKRRERAGWRASARGRRNVKPSLDECRCAVPYSAEKTRSARSSAQPRAAAHALRYSRVCGTQGYAMGHASRYCENCARSFPGAAAPVPLIRGTSHATEMPRNPPRNATF